MLVNNVGVIKLVNIMLVIRSWLIIMLVIKLVNNVGYQVG